VSRRWESITSSHKSLIEVAKYAKRTNVALGHLNRRLEPRERWPFSPELLKDQHTARQPHS